MVKLVPREMRKQLEKYRERSEAYGFDMKLRLMGVPFLGAGKLFNVRNIPCAVFGRQLVLKIIDELLDEGGKE